MRSAFSGVAKLSRLLLALLLVCACGGGSAAREPTTPKTATAPLEFEFVAPDGSKFDSASTRGRVTVVLVITTYDLASQLVARRLEDALHTTRPRINVGAVALEPPKYGVLLETFRSSLGLTYPVVLADHLMLSGQGPFGDCSFVPTLFVLDREGRLVSRRQGPLTEKQITAALTEAESASEPRVSQKDD
jgi:hypothetical protein